MNKRIEILSHFGNDLMIVNAARVSFGKNKEVFDEKDEKLIQYLVKHKHIAPFRHPQIQFRITCPIYVERQLFKHQVGMCLAGDSEISFINSSKGITKESIKSLYERWENGRNHQPSKKDSLYTKSRIKNKKLRVLNEDTGIFEIGNIKDIFYSGRKSLYEITLENGKKLKCSKDHRILTDTGFKTIKNGLKIGSNVACNGVKVVGNGKYRDYEYMKSLREQKLSVSEMAELCGCGYDNIRKWLKIHKLNFTKEERCFNKNNIPWNKNKTGYKLNISEETKKIKSEWSKKYNKSGAESKFWRGGITNDRGLIGQWTREVAFDVHKKYNFTCQKCGTSSGTLHAHHIIPVCQDISKSKDINNLITVCKQCHKDIHFSLETEVEFAKTVLSENFIPFEYTKRIGDRRKFTTKVHYSKIIDITFIGEEDTYDIEVDYKFHNFVANGIVVHNSANSISGRYVDFSDSYTTIKEWRKQSTNSKQGSDGLVENQDDCNYIQNQVHDVCKAAYNKLIDLGVSKEQARTILPLNLNTTFIWTGSLLAFIHLFNLRLKPDTQQETREIVQEMLDCIKNIEGNPFEHSLKAFEL